MKLERPDVPFTQVTNIVLQDVTLSWKARGIFAYLFSKPVDWDFSTHRMKNDATDGRESLLTGIKELEDHGYLKRARQGNGRMKYVISYAEPQSGKPTKEPESGNPTVGKPHSGKTRPVSNKEGETKKEVKKIKSVAKVPEGTLQGVEWQEVIDAWEPVNKFFDRFYKNKTQRAAITDIIKKSGKPQLLKVVKLLAQTNKISYFPNITTPVQLRDKWSSLEDAFIRKKGELIRKKTDEQKVDNFAKT